MTEAQAIADSLIETERLRLLNLNSLFSDVYQQLILIDRNDYGGEWILKHIDDNLFTSFKNLVPMGRHTWDTNYGHMNNEDVSFYLLTNKPIIFYGINVTKLFKTFAIEKNKNVDIPFVGLKINFKSIIKNYEVPDLQQIVKSFYTNSTFEGYGTEGKHTYKIKIFKHRDDVYYRYIIFFDKIVNGVFKFENHNVIDTIPDEFVDEKIVTINNYKFTTKQSDDGKQILLPSEVTKASIDELWREFKILNEALTELQRRYYPFEENAIKKFDDFERKYENNDTDFKNTKDENRERSMQKRNKGYFGFFGF